MADDRTPGGNTTTAGAVEQLAAELQPCPFCAQPLFVRRGVNPYGRCETADCWASERKIQVPLDDPRQVAQWNTRQAHSLPGDVGTRAAQIADLIVSPDTAANDIQRQAYWHVAHEAAKLALGVPEDDPACTDCGDTGVTYQTESPCSCRAALTPSALSGDAGEGWHLIDSAPKDGTEIQARIPGNGEDNVIAWVDDLIDSNGEYCGAWAFTRDQEPPDCWTDGYCWEVNEDGDRSVQPTHWSALATEAE